MADSAPGADKATNLRDDEASQAGSAPPRAPRWVVVLAGVGAVLALLFVLLHVAGRGLGGHVH